MDVTAFADRTVAVLGLARSGLAAARALARGGAAVWAWDDSEAAREAAAAGGVPIHDLSRCDWREPAALVLSPGIPHTHPAPHPVARMAREAGCPILGDVELLALSGPEAACIGITGTNGKSTTTALLGHILARAGREVEVGGNLGPPVLDMPRLRPGAAYVLEMSSYQLELTRSLVFDVAVFLNISPDHLERHGGLDGYVAAKERIFHGQTAKGTAVVGIDDERSARVLAGLRARGIVRVIPISGERPAEGGVHARGSVLIDETGGVAVPVLDLGQAPALPGVHNRQNAAAAYAAARAAGLAPEAIAEGIRTYPGLAHRQERIAEIDGVLFVNDSKATNADAAIRALVCYDAIYWIAGGRPKVGGLEGVEAHLGGVRRAFLIGEAEAVFATFLEGRVPVERCGDLRTALEAAHAAARREAIPGAVVLLSPACASFDQFKNFEARGDAFRALVEERGP